MSALPDPSELSDMWRVPHQQGWSCFPIPLGEKKPGCQSWAGRMEIKPDPETLAGWAARESNIAIVTGAISGIVVLDLDSAEAVAEAEALGIPDTIRVRTAKGQHVYFQHPGGEVRNKAGLRMRWDIRGDGGYVVGPGSIHPTGARYEWINHPDVTALAPMPDWLREMVQPQAAPAAPSHIAPLELARVDHPYCLAALDHECEAIRQAANGSQEQTLNSAAFKMGRYVGSGALSHDTAQARLLSAAQAMPSYDPHQPWTPTQLKAKVARGLKDGAQDPKEIPTANDNSSSRGRSLSEDRIALEFSRRYRNRLRYNCSSAMWLVWDESRWQHNQTRLAFHYARETVREMSGGAKSLGKASTASGVEAFARADPIFALTQDALDQDPWLLGTPGGTVDLRTGEIFAARQSDLITRQTTVAPAPGEPVRWTRFLREATGDDEELMLYLQRVAGYCLTGLTGEHALFFIYGPGGNGKSVFLNILNHILGDYATVAAMETFTASKFDRHPTDLAMLSGARLVSASETEEGRAWAESRIKQLTGGDKISARFMRQDFFQFVPQFKLVIVGNHAPLLQNVDDATRRRFNIIPFTHKPVKPDRELEEKLKIEAGQILSWAIQGCRDWQANGLVKPTVVAAATAEYFEDHDVLAQWLEADCERGPDKIAGAGELYSSWKWFAERSGEVPGSQVAFAQKLKKSGFTQCKQPGGRRSYQGIALRSGDRHQGA
jgi:putative DNA primase/helicase